MINSHFTPKSLKLNFSCDSILVLLYEKAKLLKDHNRAVWMLPWLLHTRNALKQLCPSLLGLGLSTVQLQRRLYRKERLGLLCFYAQKFLQASNHKSHLQELSNLSNRSISIRVFVCVIDLQRTKGHLKWLLWPKVSCFSWFFRSCPLQRFNCGSVRPQSLRFYFAIS
jgi:hypothetical protein